MILEPGTFNVNEYRKAIPWRSKLQAVLNAAWRFVRESRDAHQVLIPYKIAEINFDHRPPLCERPYDTVAGDFIPPQGDPQFIDAIPKADHDQRTFGRTSGAAVTVSTRGSDVGERARSSDIRATDAVHRARIALKRGDQKAADEILAGARFKKKHLRPTSKIPQRQNPWGSQKRKMGMGAKNESGNGRNSNHAGPRGRR